MQVRKKNSNRTLAAILFSLILILTIAVLLNFLPLIAAVLMSAFPSWSSQGPQTGGLSIVTGGVSSATLKTIILLPLIGIFLFAVLRKRFPWH